MVNLSSDESDISVLTLIEYSRRKQRLKDR